MASQITKFKVVNPQSTPSKVLGATAGLIPRAGTAIAGIPRAYTDLVNYGSRANPANWVLEKMGIPKEVSARSGLTSPQMPTGYLPSNEDMNKWLKSKLIDNQSSPVRDYLPRNTFETVPFLDNPFQAVVTAPLLGASTLGSIIPALMGEAGNQLGEKMDLNPILRFLLSGAGAYGGSKLQQGAGAISKYAAPTTSKNVQKFAEKYIPGARVYNQVASQEERAAQKAAQSMEREESRISSMRDKMNQEAIEEASAMDYEGVKAKEAEAAANAKEAQRLKNEVEKSNQASIDEASTRDADMMKRRTTNANAIDKFQAENDHMMSLEDAAKLKENIKKGKVFSLEDWLDQKSKDYTTEAGSHARMLQDMTNQEGITMAREGASPKEVKAQIGKLFESAERVIPDTLEYGASAFEGSLNQLEGMLGKSKLTGSPQEVMREIVDEGRNLIKNGKVNVKGLMKFKQSINGKMRKLKLNQGDLVGVEKQYGVVTKAIDNTMARLKRTTGDAKIGKAIEDWFEGNRMTKNLAMDAEASKWFSAEMNKGALKHLAWISEKGGAYWNSPEVNKYVKRAVARYADRDLKQATRDLVMADRMAENVIKKENIKITPRMTGKIQKFKVTI